MKKYFFAILTVAVALCGCSKDELLTNEQLTNGEADKSEVIEPMVFTATMEGAPGTRAIYDSENKCASWEVNDWTSINGLTFSAETAGTSTTFVQRQEVRPTHVTDSHANAWNAVFPAKLLVDDEGTSTHWSVSDAHKNSEGTWDIIVKTSKPVKLLAINLWNSYEIEKYPSHQWKDVKVSGSSSESGEWTEIKTFENVGFNCINSELAGTLDVNATTEYEFYKVEVLASVGRYFIMMSDMKFVISDAGTPIQAPYTAYFPSYLYDGSIATLPSEITEKWTEGKFNMPMYAYSTDTGLEFKNLCGVLKITVKSSQIATVKSISVSTDKAISGAFTVDANNAAVLTNPNNEDNTITINYSNAVTTDAIGKVFYVPLPAQTYGNLVIQVSDGTQSLSMTTKSGANIVVARNKIYPITFMHDNYLYSDGDESYVEEDENVGNGWFR